MNERLYAAVDAFSDVERKRDCGAFFGSMHGTLNHLLWGDRVWLGRFVGEPCTVPAYGVAMFDDFALLRHERERTDQAMLNWASAVTPEWLGSTVAYTSAADGRRRRLPAAAAAIHLFHHGIHHRGQLTTLIRQAGRDPGPTDLPWLPGLVRFDDD
jgi:uncharacterized damage-inducible protein DinB